MDRHTEATLDDWRDLLRGHMLPSWSRGSRSTLESVFSRPVQRPKGEQVGPELGN